MLLPMPHCSTPQLEHLHSGKVRDSFRIDPGRRLLVATDRISCFDRVLDTPIPGKGAVLNGLAAWWFGQVADLGPTHFLQSVDPAAMVVRETQPIRLEVIVRGYLTGSAWRAYARGRREISGVPLPEGMTENQPFPEPILTPTTKEASDREISAADLIAEGWATEETWREMADFARRLYERGREVLAARGLILVDAKYEFGRCDQRVALIDELHTPDAARFWDREDYERDPTAVTFLDKEAVRQWLQANRTPEGFPTTLPDYVVEATHERYRLLFRRITGHDLALSDEDPRDRLTRNLTRSGLIKPGFVAVVMGSAADLEFGRRVAAALEPYGVAVDLRVASAHKNGEDVVAMAREYNEAIEPGAVIAVAGRSNGLGGALAANLALPVINCPPFKDLADYQVNIHSSLQMPSHTPALTILSPEAAALAAVRCLNRHLLRDTTRDQIERTKAALQAEDRRVRGRA